MPKTVQFVLINLKMAVDFRQRLWFINNLDSIRIETTFMERIRMRSIMNGLCTIGMILVLFSIPALAESKYISDTMKITLRTGPGKDRKIISLLGIGQKVDVLQPGDEWTRVSLANGKEGWVISRFLTNKTPSDIQLKVLKDKHKAIMNQNASLQQANTLLKAENKRLDKELGASGEKLQKITSDHETLKSESTEFLELQSKYKKMTSELAEKTKKAGQFEDELTKLLWNQNIKWFLSGAGVLILGFIIGFSTKRQRRRSSLL